VDIWRGEFHVNNIGVNHNFFELGGHSLLAARIVSLVERYLHKKIKVQDVYKADTIRELACIVDASEICHSVSGKPVLSSANKVIPLSDFQFMYWISELFEPKVKKLNIVIRKRMDTRLDINALEFAFKSVFKKHEVLVYQASKWLPYQRMMKDNQFTIQERDLSDYGDSEQEYFLTASLNEMLDEYSFAENKPSLDARLFYLNKNYCEIQLCLSHSVFDDVSGDILFAELSNAYLQYKNGIKSDLVLREYQYKDYVTHERNVLNRHISQDVEYWQEYFHDADLLTVPKSVVINDMNAADNSYSTYLEMPDEFALVMKSITSEYRLSASDVICAAITLALRQTSGRHNSHKVLLNIIKSSRDQEAFDNMIGCFLHLDPLKVDLHSSSNLPELARSIQAARIETEPHQYCSGMVKLACLDKSFRKTKLKDAFIGMMAGVYAKLFKRLALDPQMLHMYSRLNGLKVDTKFLVNINILNSFTNPERQGQIFGAHLVPTRLHRYNVSNIDNVLDICLMRDVSSNKCYLVVSGNLQDSFRKQIGNEIIGVMMDVRMSVPDMVT
jgi:Condensation domain/Phosphopantetheine attachment site